MKLGVPFVRGRSFLVAIRRVGGRNRHTLRKAEKLPGCDTKDGQERGGQERGGQERDANSPPKAKYYDTI